MTAELTRPLEVFAKLAGDDRRARRLPEVIAELIGARRLSEEIAASCETQQTQMQTREEDDAQ